MGKVNFTLEQQFAVGEFLKNKELATKFYLTGGTALSVFYLQHRFSEDLDFFSETEFTDYPIINFINKICSKLGLENRFTKIDELRVFDLTKKGKSIVKVDFNYYPFQRLEKGENINRLQVDSMLDIAVNKLLMVNQRLDVKDFVDLYFLLRQFSIWDLMEGVKNKFGMELDPILVGSDFLKVEDFDFLPKMVKPLALEELKSFFRKRAKEIGERVTY